MRMIQMMYSTDGVLLGLCENGVIFEYYAGGHMAPEHCPVSLPDDIVAELQARKQRVRLRGWVPMANQHPAVVTLAGKYGEQPKYSSALVPWLEATDEEKNQFACALRKAREGDL